MRLITLKSLAVFGIALLALTPKGYAMSSLAKDSPKPVPATGGAVVQMSNIILSCPTSVANADALCKSMESALKKRASNHSIQLGSRAPAKGELAITLHIIRANTQMIEGYLQWRTDSAGPQKGPPVTLTVSDTTLKPKMFDQFTSGLIQLSDLPIP